MRILLVFPPMTGKDRYGRLAVAGSYLPPLGLASIAAVVEKEHPTRIIDGSIRSFRMEELEAEVRQWQPDLVGVSVITATFYRAVDVCRVVKKARPGVFTVLGGPHPSSAPLDSMADPAVDAVVVGEGEETFRELVAALEARMRLEDVRGIVFRRDGEVVSNPPRKPIADLDALPFPARHLLPLARYRPSPLNYKRLPAFSIVASRGCPYRCTFCACSKVFTGRLRTRSTENVLQEIRMLKERHGAREILLWDDLFGFSREWTLEFCEKIAPLGLTWSAWMRVDRVDPELLARMADSGCWNISYGVESGDPAILESIRKGITLEQVRDAFAWTRAAGIEARGTFILGLPGETLETMRKTVDLAIDVDADFAQFQLLTPLPGSGIWEEVARERTVDADLSRFTIWFPVFVPAGLSEDSLTRAHRAAYRRFYLRPRYLAQRLRRIRSLSDLRRNVIGTLAVLNMVGKRG